VVVIACAGGPSVNIFIIFHIFRIENFKIGQCEHFDGSTDFSFQTQFLQFICISRNKIHSQMNITLTLSLSLTHTHLTSENCEINSIKSDSSKAFQQHQERPQIPVQFFSLDFI
jgi:hypothetical protein